MPRKHTSCSLPMALDERGSAYIPQCFFVKSIGTCSTGTRVAFGATRAVISIVASIAAEIVDFLFCVSSVAVIWTGRGVESG